MKNHIVTSVFCFLLGIYAIHNFKIIEAKDKLDVMTL